MIKTELIPLFLSYINLKRSFYKLNSEELLVIINLENSKLKIVMIKMTIFFKRRVSIALLLSSS